MILLTCGNELVSCGNDFLTCGNDLVTCGNDLLSRGNKIKNDRKTVLCPFLGSIWNLCTLSIFCNVNSVRCHAKQLSF